MGERLRAARIVVRYVYRADRARSVGSALVAVGTVVAGLLTAVVLKFLTDAAFQHDEQSIVVGAVLLTTASAVTLVGGWAGTTLGMALRERATLHFDTRMAELTAGIHHIEHHERPDYLDELFILRHNHQQLASVQDALVTNLSTLLRLVLTVLLLAQIHPLLLLLPLAGIPSVVASVHVAHFRHRVEDQVAPQRRLVLRLFDIGSTRDAAKEIRIYDLGDELLSRSDDARAIAHGLEDQAAWRAGVLGALGWLVFGLGFVGAMVVVAQQATAGRASPGDVVLALTLAGSVNTGVTGLANTVGWLLDNLKTGQRLAWLEDLAADADRAAAPADPAAVPDVLREGIRFEAVAFGYPGTAATVLHHLDLFLPAGSTVAIVGDNGAGKTTLVKLLCRFYDATDGRITIDGVDLRRFDVAEWRRRLSGCFQDFARPELMARESVGVGDLAAIDDDEAVMAALERAHADDVAATLPSGLSTLLGRSFDGGVEPSTGQWQKMALGRAMMREEPLLLVLDEPTASLDATTEHGLFERYARAAARASARTGAITVLVSHRFSTVRMADIIVVLAGGRIVELGTHEELVTAGGGYAELYELQASAYR
jgi:ATP-binding cassette subfamily B protein